MVYKRLFCLFYSTLYFFETTSVSSRKNLIARIISDFVEYKPLSSDPPFFQVGFTSCCFSESQILYSEKED